MSLIQIIRTDSEDAFAFLRKRGATLDSQISNVVAEIVRDVAQRGDAALLDSARKFDSPDIETIKVSPAELEKAKVQDRFLSAIRESIRNVRHFHDVQLSKLTAGWSGNRSWKENQIGGGYLGQRLLPVASAGIYVPGGNADYPSSVIMNGLPALAAGVRRICITSPARKNGRLSDSVLVSARECGVKEIYKIGGAAAIAALALGTETIARVDKIAGPGNRFVNEAKRQLWGTVGLDLYAGPSEVCIAVEDASNSEYAAADLLTQVEHAPDNAGFIVGTSEASVLAVIEAAEAQLTRAPRADVMREALRTYGAAFICRDPAEACAVIDAIAPEHLSLSVQHPDAWLMRIHNAGCILMGEDTPESAGDFAMGPSHTLPTSTAARFASPVNVMDFLRFQSVSRLSREGLERLTPIIEAFGEMEGFPAHGYGATVRRKT